MLSVARNRVTSAVVRRRYLAQNFTRSFGSSSSSARWLNSRGEGGREEGLHQPKTLPSGSVEPRKCREQTIQTDPISFRSITMSSGSPTDIRSLQCSIEWRSSWGSVDLSFDIPEPPKQAETVRFSSHLSRNLEQNAKDLGRCLGRSVVLRQRTLVYDLPIQRQIASFSTEPARDEKSSSDSAQQEEPKKKIPSRKIGKTQIPTPESAPPVQPNPLETLKQTSPKSLVRKGLDMTISVSKAIVLFLLKVPGNTLFYLTHPTELRQKLSELHEAVKEEVNHYWVGTKLLWADIQTARAILAKTLEGNSLTRRERKQLLRTVSDLFRLVPFSMFVLIPFMEFLLPFALRLFPNMLPSTYQDSLKAEENMKRELKSRIAMAQFFQETMEELAKEQKRKASKRKKELEEAGIDLSTGDHTIKAQDDSAGSMLEFLEKARSGEMIPPDVIIRYANYFQDDLTLDNMPRMQLINMCKYMGIQPYGNDSFLRFQLRHKIRVLKEDDQRIIWEGIDSLTKMELREACQERGMRSTGLSKDAYKRALQQWLDLSVHKDVPISLLIMSRTFFLREDMFEQEPEDKSIVGLADAISGMEKNVLNEVILQVATSEEKKSDPDVRKIKLEVVEKQNELIREEAKQREASAKKKEELEKKEKVEVSAAEEFQIGESPPHPEAGPLPPADTTVAEAPETTESEEGLSAEEMDAISQLVSEDPVSKERKELERIKAAMKAEEEAEKKAEKLETEAESSVREVDIATSSSPGPLTSDEADLVAKVTIEKMDKDAAREAGVSAKITVEEGKEAKEIKLEMVDETLKFVEEEELEEEDPVVARLKKRVESMVDKIEVQLSETQLKIGDKLHVLDKDKDGLLTEEEVITALQQVLKRKISFEEAVEIANEMDTNRDGIFTVGELVKWCDEHKLERLVKEGRDAEMDKIIESQSVSQQKEEVTVVNKAESKGH